MSIRSILYLIALFAFHAEAQPTDSPIVPVESDRIENLFQYSPKLFSGGQPVGEKGFSALAELGVKTVISVDGARPDVENAEAQGMQYIHLPISYDGIPYQQALSIAKAIRNATGPVFIHCHHGRHRGPAAGAMALAMLGQWTPEKAIEAMKLSKTSPKYAGLYQCVNDATPASEADFARLPDSFPRIAETPPMAELMARIQRTFDRLKFCRQTGWSTPDDHPDVVPAREALMLKEDFTEMLRMDADEMQDPVFAAMTEASMKASAELETALNALNEADDLNGVIQQADARFQQIQTTCISCHDLYRNAPLNK